MKKVTKILVFVLIFVSFWMLSAFVSFARADVVNEILTRQKQIDELQRQINDYQKVVDQQKGKAKTLSSEISRLNSTINKVQLEIESLGLSIDQTDEDIIQTQEDITDAKNRIILHKDALGKHIQTLYQLDQRNLTYVLLKNDKLSDFFKNLQNVTNAQDNLRANILAISDLKVDLEARQEELEDKRTELDTLKDIQESQNYNLSINKREKNNLLAQTKGEETKFQNLVNEGQKDINAIRDQITFLQKHGISVDDAIKYGQLSAARAGIRPAFLLALLDVESRQGKYTGTGNWEDDMYKCYLRLADYYPHKKDYYIKRANTEKNAYFVIVNKLGIDANSVKVSKEPPYGCGGAMGPAQFIPSTWLGYEDEVARLTGHNPPNPWSIEDSFMASAIKLARGGADSKTRAGEIGASKAYIGGSTKCSSSICNYYSNLVQDKAAIIEANL